MSETVKEIRLPVVSFFLGVCAASFVALLLAAGDEDRARACHKAIQSGADQAVLMAVCR
jgi:hypothetical protein